MSQTWIQPNAQPTEEFCQAVQALSQPFSGEYIAQILWERGIRDIDRLPGFIHAAQYTPHSPYDFGEEMQLAVDRLKTARDTGEKVAIWGDFDADGVTSTSVLWDGLGQFFDRATQLTYYIPNRFTESHGISKVGLDLLHEQGYTLIVTCDTGSTNIAEIEYAQTLGMETIVTDHHTLPDERPPVAAIVNPRFLDQDHPFYSFSGVAVAYKLVEALYLALPDVPTQPLAELLDLVAIGLIADLVELKGDCRYLCQQGIKQLQKQSKPETATRPGISRLLQLCKKTGDRPTDVSFGIGPRINAVSRIQGDAHFCVELLTSQDVDRCRTLAEETELANARRKSLQQDVYKQALAKAQTLDLSTTYVLVLWDEQWHPGVLGLVASQLAQEFGRPAVLLSTEDGMARGSARSIRQIDLYKLVKAQAHLLHRFGGHPFAAGLSLTMENLPIFADAVNQKMRQDFIDVDLDTEEITADLVIPVAALGKDLFQELKLLEPCGMGNPAPRLWIQDCHFERTWQRNIQDMKGKKIKYIKTDFEIVDASVEKGFPGVWWGHYREELPPGQCDALVELDNNTYKKRYEVRLLAVRSAETATNQTDTAWLLDWRTEKPPKINQKADKAIVKLTQVPHNWQELQTIFRRVLKKNKSLAIAYKLPTSGEQSHPELWSKLIGIAKYMSRTEAVVTRQTFQKQLGISTLTLKIGFEALQQLGFSITSSRSGFKITEPVHQTIAPEIFHQATATFEQAIQEETFRQHYFSQVPFSLLQSIAKQISLETETERAEVTAPD
ncbi:single-stranded-DNA-specific exonuclease RecJ [filamentous cyanobacterium LEGE 11480]|uniref:Single-stranded-DNA-specific exonuclease RecJ n=1 Tax=Romeriopsis navalis LEGE 11480 TaxID=2777977 RepID=A0A928Z4C7_9CYAN|nr:single-stranded-DNA-specific exonuclease RecJ [Romeriopsis navalis]MBE9032461.1 single-stranded-DNA-specific exonuclease RecJ [Romeriopsis navalis LEGE 11480]